METESLFCLDQTGREDPVPAVNGCRRNHVRQSQVFSHLRIAILLPVHRTVVFNKRVETKKKKKTWFEWAGGGWAQAAALEDSLRGGDLDYQWLKQKRSAAAPPPRSTSSLLQSPPRTPPLPGLSGRLFFAGSPPRRITSSLLKSAFSPSSSNPPNHNYTFENSI